MCVCVGLRANVNVIAYTPCRTCSVCCVYAVSAVFGGSSSSSIMMIVLCRVVCCGCSCPLLFLLPIVVVVVVILLITHLAALSVACFVPRVRVQRRRMPQKDPQSFFIILFCVFYLFILFIFCLLCLIKRNVPEAAAQRRCMRNKFKKQKQFNY